MNKTQTQHSKSHPMEINNYITVKHKREYDGLSSTYRGKNVSQTS